MLFSFRKMDLLVIKFDRVGDHGKSNLITHGTGEENLQLGLHWRQCDLVPLAKFLRKLKKILEFLDGVGKK